MWIQVGRMFAFGVLALFASGQWASGQVRALGGVFVTAEDADFVAKAANRYRVYDAPGSLLLSLGLNNESSEAYTIREQALVEGVGIGVSVEGREVPVTASWSRQEPAGEPRTPETRIVTGRSGKWRLSLARTDGRPFEPGEYTLHLSLAAALHSVRADDGQRWRGRFDAQDARLVIECAPPDPDKPAEVAAANRQRGFIALKAGRIEEAIGAFQRAITVEPYDLTSLAEIGGAYIRLKRYREAIGPLQRAMQALPSANRPRATLLIHDLALAHLGAGDEKSAVSVLQASGRFDVARTIAKLREEVGRHRE